MSKIIIRTNDAPEPIGPYSQAVLTGNTLYISGQIAINPKDGLLIEGTVKDEAVQVMKNLEAILKAAKMNFSQIVKCSIFLQDMNDFAEVNEVYSRYFQNDPPARETVAVKTLPKNVRVEISAIAVE